MCVSELELKPETRYHCVEFFYGQNSFLPYVKVNLSVRGKVQKQKEKKKKANKHSTKQMTLKLYSEQNNYVSV